MLHNGDGAVLVRGAFCAALEFVLRLAARSHIIFISRVMLDALKSQQLRPHFPFSFNIFGHHHWCAARVYEIRTQAFPSRGHGD
jgi:hypothetical protein